jgi:hypothetical protein
VECLLHSPTCIKKEYRISIDIISSRFPHGTQDVTPNNNDMLYEKETRLTKKEDFSRWRKKAGLTTTLSQQ